MYYPKRRSCTLSRNYLFVYYVKYKDIALLLIISLTILNS